MLLAFFQLFLISLLFLSTAFWLGLQCFCWTSSPLGTQADMKLPMQCFQVRASISAWNPHVLLWGIQYEYCDSHYSICQIKRRCPSQCCINTVTLHCSEKTKSAVSLPSAHKNVSQWAYHPSTPKRGYQHLGLSKIIPSFLEKDNFVKREDRSSFSLHVTNSAVHP